MPLLRSLLLVAIAAPIAGAQTLDVARLAVGRDSFTLVMRGTVRGAMSVTRARTAGRVRITTDMSAPGIGYLQHREIVLDSATLGLVSHAERETYEGITVQTQVAVTNGRATGRAEEQGETGVRRTLVDVAVPPRGLSADAIIDLLATMTFIDGFRSSFPTFAVFPGTAKTADLTVLGRQSLTVQAGTFDAFRLRLAIQGRPPREIFVTAAAPHRVLSIRDNNSDLQLVK